jgi:hypothetical protein
MDWVLLGIVCRKPQANGCLVKRETMEISKENPNTFLAYKTMISL